jgi:membrane protein DedA with SNARE-associated domain
VGDVAIELCTAARDLAGVLEAIEHSGGAAAYGLMVLVLVLGACGVPVPEEAVFATAGALAATGRTTWWLTYVVGWSAIVILDLCLHTVGRWSGPGVRRSRLGRRIGRRRWAAARRFMALRGTWAVLGARFVMGTRIPVFLLAGAAGMPRRRFLLVVGSAGLVSVALPLSLGYFLGARLDALLDALGTARWLLVALVAAGLGAWWLLARRRRARAT